MEKTEQWKLSGNCELCRRRDYCTKPCTAQKRHKAARMRQLSYTIMAAVAGREMADRAVENGWL